MEKEFFVMESQSVDYGIMEKAENIFTIPGTFGWDDVGSWLTVERIRKREYCCMKYHYSKWKKLYYLGRAKTDRSSGKPDYC